MLFFLAGLQNISADVDEAAAVDGAPGWQRFRYITMPLMRPSIALVVHAGAHRQLAGLRRGVHHDPGRTRRRRRRPRPT